MKLGKMLSFKIMGDERGNLISLESMKNIPFEIKRVYYIFDNLPGVERGFHAHRNLEQVVVCINGSCTFVVDDGEVREEVELNNRSQGLYINQFIWREMKNFSKDAVLMVLASQYYDEQDYIRNYEEFKSFTRNRGSTGE